MNTLQRGFVDVDGTLANAVLLEYYMNARRKGRKTYNVVSLDISKVFDTVSHFSLIRALWRLDIEESMIKYIQTTFQSSTVMNVPRMGRTHKLSFNRGVRQGDPLSPLLFVAVMDELLTELNDGSVGGSIGDQEKVACLVFADDLILLADKDVDMPVILDTVSCFVAKRGMEINPTKSRALSVGIVKGAPVVRTKSIFSVNRKKIPTMDYLDSFRYLGQAYNATGVLKPSLTNLQVWLDNVDRSPLKPHQKVDLINTFLTPKLLYGLQNYRVNSRILRDADRMIKSSVRFILHLHTRTARWRSRDHRTSIR